MGGVGWAFPFGVTQLSDAPLRGAVVGVGALAVLTRGLHLDGLADVADGLGSGRPAEEARDVMKRSDVGPFGGVTLGLVVLAQVAALAALLAASPVGIGAVALIGAAVVSRGAIGLTCRRGVPAASPDGLGSQVAGVLSPAVAGAVALASIAAVSAAASAVDPELAPAYVISGLIAISVGEVWRRHCSRRFGGITGDVLGSVEQLTFTAFVATLLLVLA
ncbi:MAG: adenosylcobinamide-GDP ribazoletransferase [Actinomycetia bacterium]|nr:adenosylcobinamide-GDP ribazoletransferase [Actinomycetes bacterium]